MENDNMWTRYSFSIVKEKESNGWKGWVFRAFCGLVLVGSGWKVFLHRSKNKKKVRSTTNLSLHEFEIRVKLNSKKSLDYIDRSEGGSQDSFHE